MTSPAAHTLSLLVPVLLLVAACQSSTPSQEPSTPAREPAPAPPEEVVLRQVDKQSMEDPFGLPAITGENKRGDYTLRYRHYVPRETPSYVPRQQDGLDLFVADSTEKGWLAFYKGQCGTAIRDVCDYAAALFGPGGTTRWVLDLNRYLSGDRYLEIQDIRYHDGALYFNEACATYARDAEGQCSSLLRVNPQTGEVTWRTPPLTSNNIFIVHDPYIIAGYGFTSEPDSVYVLSQESGHVVARAGLDTAHQYLEMQNGKLYVITQNSLYTFALEKKT